MSSTPKYVARGTFGCVLSPPPKCQDGTRIHGLKGKQVVGKVFHEVADMKEEVDSYTKISKAIDPHGIFTVKIYGHCPVPFQNIPQSELDKCKYNMTELESYNRNIYVGEKPDFHQIVYDNGGRQLNGIQGKGKFKTLVLAMRPLFKGVVRMVRMGVAHQDIKPPNVVFNEQTDRMFLIDFGISATFENLYNKNNLHALGYLYPYFPPEYRYAAHIISRKPHTVAISERDMVRNFDYFDEHYMSVKTCKLTPARHNNLVHVYYNATSESLKELEGKDLAWLVENAAPKLDVYMLGMLLLHSLSTVEKVSAEEEKIILGLVWGMIHPMLSKRFTAKFALKAYDMAMSLLYGVTPESRASPPVHVKTAQGVKEMQNSQPGSRSSARSVRVRQLEAMPIKSLKAIVKELGGLRGYGSMKKAELVERLASMAPAQLVEHHYKQSCKPGEIRSLKTGRCRSEKKAKSKKA